MTKLIHSIIIIIRKRIDMINKESECEHHMMIRIGTSIREFLGVPPHVWLKLGNNLRFNHIEFYSSVFLEI